MTVTKDQLENFHRFANERVDRGGAELTFEELVAEWRKNQDREQVNALIRRGLADIDAGRGRPVEDVLNELRQRYDISAE